MNKALLMVLAVELSTATEAVADSVSPWSFFPRFAGRLYTFAGKQLI